MSGSAKLVVVIVALGFLNVAGGAQAQVTCGATLGPGGKLQMTDNLACGTDPALTLVGPVRLEMNGFRITCIVNTTDGILVKGQKVAVSNGAVGGCRNGLAADVGSSGRHKLTSFASTGNAELGISLLGNRNQLSQVTAARNGHSGIFIQGDRNKITDSTSTGTFVEGHGFAVVGDGNRFTNNVASAIPPLAGPNGRGFDVTGDGNQFKKNTASFIGNWGFNVQGNGNKFTGNISAGNDNWGFNVGGVGNLLSRNTSSGNTNYGFFVDGDGNRVAKNTSKGNGNDGFMILGDGAEITGNTASGNTNHGFGVSGTDHELKGNHAQGNLNVGIWVDSTSSTVSGNQATGNDPADLQDANGAGCDGNTWSRNTFGLSAPAQPSCIE